MIVRLTSSVQRFRFVDRLSFVPASPFDSLQLLVDEACVAELLIKATPDFVGGFELVFPI